MKKQGLLFIIFFLNACFGLDNIDKEKAMEFSKKYQLSKINTNRADVNYAREYEDIANDEVAKKYQNLKEDKIDISKYKGLGKAKAKITDKMKNLDTYNKNATTNERIKRQLAPTFNYTKKKTSQASKKEVVAEENKMFVDDTSDIELSEVEEIVIISDEDEEKIKEFERKKAEEKIEQEAQLDSLKKQTELLSKNKKLKHELESIIQKNKDYNETQMTVFFFASSDLDISNFNDFSASVEKLDRKGYNISGRVIFRGLIDDTLDGIPNWFKRNEERGLNRSSVIKYQFNPFAFNHFSLDRVPAFALSACKKDFRFKTCEHKFLIKGNMSFKNFIEVIAEYHSEYDSVLTDLVGVE